MLLDDDYDIPADADAVVLAPSLVSDRYVQFAPVYDGGPTMEDGAEVPLDRTATPVELDQVYGALDELSAALGPTGANENGALSDLRRRRRGQPRGQRRGAQPDADRLLAGRARRSPRTATTCSPRWTTCRRSPARWPRIDAQVGAVQRQHGRRRRPARRRAGGPRRGGRSCSTRRSADVAGFVQDNTDAADHQRQPAGRRHPRPGPAARGAGRGARRRAGGAGQPVPRLQPRLRHARHPRQRPRVANNAEIVVCGVARPSSAG